MLHLIKLKIILFILFDEKQGKLEESNISQKLITDVSSNNKFKITIPV